MLEVVSLARASNTQIRFEIVVGMTLFGSRMLPVVNSQKVEEFKQFNKNFLKCFGVLVLAEAIITGNGTV